MTLKKDIVINDRARATLQYILAFGIPLLVILLAYIGLRITPFGDKTIIISDAKALYTSDLAYISRLLHGQEDFLYSFKSSIGINMMEMHGGVMNPLYAISYFSDITAIPVLYSWIMALDMAFCGLTMFVFLSSVYGRKNYNLLFSTVYALIGFNVASCFQIYFLLGVELLPLIALGVKKIVSGKSPWLYLITLGYSIFSGFYYGYMLCIASLVLFLMWFAESRKDAAPIKGIRIWINYLGSSFTAGLLPALMWLPALLSISGGRLDQTSILDFTMSENVSIGDMFAKFFIGANNTDELVNGAPNVFCGSLVLFLVVAFFVDRRNTVRAKIIRGIPLLFYFLTFYVKALSMVVQGFSTTNWFNFRYSYVFSFLMIIIAIEEFSKIREIEVKDIKRAILVFVAVVAITFMQRYTFVSGGWMVVDILILCGCLGAIWWNRIDTKRAPQRVLVILLVLLCAGEGYANYLVCTNQLSEWALKESDYQKSLFNGSIIAEAVTSSDPDFYRMANEHGTWDRCNNDSRLFGYNGLNYFGSCERKFVFQGMSKLGMPWFSNRMWYAEGEPAAFDSLFGLKYVVAQRNLTEEKGYEELFGIEDDTVYRNDMALPIGMVADDSVVSVTLGRNPFENHNTLWKALTGQGQEVFTHENDITFTYHVNNDGESVNYRDAQEYSASVSMKAEKEGSASESESSVVGTSEDDSASTENNAETYADMQNEAVNSGSYIECTFTAMQDGPVYSYICGAVADDSGYSMEAMHYLGTYKKGEEIKDYIAVSVSLSKDVLKGFCSEYYVAYANDDALTEYVNKLQSSTQEITKVKDSHLTGSVTAEKDGRLFFTIPFDEGWTLTIDGTEIELEKTADLFLSAPIKAGSHTYEMVFFPKGMKTGMVISGAGVVLLLLLIAYNISLRRRQKVSAAGNVGQEDKTVSSSTVLLPGQDIDIDDIPAQVKEPTINRGEGDADD